MLQRLKAWLWLRFAAPAHTTVRLYPGDTLCVIFNEPQSYRACDMIRARVKHFLPENRVLVFTEPVSLVSLAHAPSN